MTTFKKSVRLFLIKFNGSASSACTEKYLPALHRLTDSSISTLHLQ